MHSITYTQLSILQLSWSLCHAQTTFHVSQGGLYIKSLDAASYSALSINTQTHSWTSCCKETLILAWIGFLTNRDWAAGTEEEELTSCCCRDAPGTGGFISAHARTSFCLDFIKQWMGCLMSHYHEDDFKVSAGYHQKNAPSFWASEREDFTLLDSLQFTTQAYKLQGWRIGTYLVAQCVVFK